MEGRKKLRKMSEQLEKYEKLKLKECMGSIQRYPLVCKELSLILRGAYTQLPKNLQSLILQDTLTAFRLLPQMQTCGAVSAAHLLFQSVDATLPKQKKNLAVAEYKNAMVAHRRSKRPQQEENVANLPEDVLVHVFGLLDFESLVSAGLVCGAWNFAASDNRLWQRQYAIFFTISYLTIQEKYNNEHVEDECYRLFWRKAFKEAYRGHKSSTKIKSNRGYCRICDTIVWLDNMICFNKHIKVNPDIQVILPVVPSQVVDYLLEDSKSYSSDNDYSLEDFKSIRYSSESDSDSDSDIGRFSRLWAYRN